MSEEQHESKTQLVRTLASSLWFPLVFFFGFLFCYMLSFHAPQPHDVQVAVSGRAAAAQVSAGLEKKAPGAFDILPAADAAAARHKVLDREAAAAYTVHGGKATLYLAKASGTQLETVAKSTFSQVAAASKTPFHSTELVPTASGDTTGTGLFYLTMVWDIVPYIAVMMLMRAALSRRGKLLALVGTGAFVSVVGYYIGLAMHVVPNEPLAILFAFMLTQAIAWTTYGLAPFVRQFLPGVAITLFVMLSIPASGGAIPYQFVPAFFRALHPVMPLGNLIDILHGIFYFNGQGITRAILVLCAWLALGVCLVAVGALLQRRRAQQPEAETTAEEQVEEPIEDPSLETATPRASHPDAGEHFGEQAPMLVGTVTLTNGEPVPHAFVTLLATGGRQLMRTTTDSEGRYAADGLPEDFVTIVLLTPGHSPAVARFLPDSGYTLRQDFVLSEPTRDAPSS